MATAPDIDKVLRSTEGKENFQRLARLLISGGTTLLREIFDQLCPPSSFPTILKNPATEKQLKAAKLTKPQWDCLYPSPGVYGKSADFDVTLLFKLLRTICNLIPPATGWDELPTSTDHSLAADLVRIKYYRNTVYGHVNQQMEIADDFQFLSLWQEISRALVRIAGQISLAKKVEWQVSIDKFLKDPLTVDDERNVQELLEWYRNDMEVKKSLEELKASTQKGLEHLEGVVDGTVHAIEKKSQVLENTMREEAQDIKDQLGGELKTTTEEVQCLEIAVREESQDIKDQLTKVQQSIDRLSSSVASSQTSLAPLIEAAFLRLRIDGEAISGPALQGGSSHLALVSPEHDAGIHEAAFVQAEVTEDDGTVSIKTNPAPTIQDVLNLAAHKYLQTIDPSKPEDLNGFVYYLEKVRKVLIVDTQSGSLIITVECRSQEILDGLWEDYCAGYLDEMVQKFLVTEELLKEIGLTEVKLTTTILEEDYRNCLEYLWSTGDAIPWEMKIFVKTYSENTVITLYVEPYDTIQSVKQ